MDEPQATARHRAFILMICSALSSAPMGLPSLITGIPTACSERHGYQNVHGYAGIFSARR